jgi:hypothetical protein
MSGILATNITVTAAGPARLRLATDNDQSGLYDLPVTGPVTVELTENNLSMTGTISGAEASFEWSGGRIEDSRITNAVPLLISSSATRWVTDSQWHIQNNAIHTNAKVYLSRSALYNVVDSTYQLASDGELLVSSGNYGDFYNQGTFIKTGGNGVTEIKAIFHNQEGMIAAERGLLHFSSALDFTNGAVQIALGGVGDAGRIQSASAITIDGSMLNVNLRDGYTPSVGDSFVLLSGSSLTGTFMVTNLPTLYSGHFWNVDYDSSTVKLTVASPEDTDGDLIKDSWEIDKFGSIAVSNGGDDNSDADSFTDYYEYIADTDPTNAASYFEIMAVSNNSPVTIYFLASSNRLYSLLGCTNLAGNMWLNVPGEWPRSGIGGTDFMQDTNVPAKGPYYRMQVELP